MPITIKKCTISDLDELLWISETTFYEAFVSKNTEEAMSSYMKQAFNLQQLKSELENQESAFYFAYHTGKLSGYFKISTGNAQVEKYSEKTIELARIYVIKEFRNLKIGEQMLQKAIVMGEAINAEFIWLGVWDRNPEAIRFYERHGFAKYGQHPFIMGKEEQTDLLYRRYLK